jgi:class 3 adenylate cyclase
VVVVADSPSGIVTFLFTDIEGSTVLWEQHPHEMPEALEKHERILHQAVESHQGVVFKNTGDGVCAVFPVASDAAGTAWTRSGPLSPRSGRRLGRCG